MSVTALTASQVPNIGIGLLIGIIVVGVVIAIIVSSLVSRIVIAAIVLALGTYVWQQRTVIQHRITTSKCQLNTTFFGIHVKAPADVVQACQGKIKS
jgi:type II secretory pathway pseudopilin PulG